MVARSSQNLVVSPDLWAVVSLPEHERLLAAAGLGDDVRALGGGSFVVSEPDLQRLPGGTQVSVERWRRIAVRTALGRIEAIAAACSALAEVGVPALVFAHAKGFDLFVPQEKIGRALAALRQARLERFAPQL